MTVPRGELVGRPHHLRPPYGWQAALMAFALSCASGFGGTAKSLTMRRRCRLSFALFCTEESNAAAGGARESCEGGDPAADLQRLRACLANSVCA